MISIIVIVILHRFSYFLYIIIIYILVKVRGSFCFFLILVVHVFLIRICGTEITHKWIVITSVISIFSLICMCPNIFFVGHLFCPRINLFVCSM